MEVSVFNSKLLLGGIEVAKSAVGFIKLGMSLSELVLELLGSLLSSSLITSKTVQGGLGIISITLHGIVVLLAEHGKGRLVLDVGFLEVTAELSKLTLTLLVELNLGGSGTTSFIQTIAKISKLASQTSLSLLSLATSRAFMLNFDIEFLNAGLQFLDLLVALVDEDLFVVELAAKGRNFLLLALNGVLEFLEVAFQVSNSLLGKLKVSLN